LWAKASEDVASATAAMMSFMRISGTRQKMLTKNTNAPAVLRQGRLPALREAPPKISHGPGLEPFLHPTLTGSPHVP
jgi:hypothetical protein